MPAIGFLLVLLFGLYAALKYYKTQQQTTGVVQDAVNNPPGVSYYCNLAVSNRPAQVFASEQTNSCAVTQPGFAPAFGQSENIPSSNEELPI